MEAVTFAQNRIHSGRDSVCINVIIKDYVANMDGVALIIAFLHQR